MFRTLWIDLTELVEALLSLESLLELVTAPQLVVTLESTSPNRGIIRGPSLLKLEFPKASKLAVLLGCFILQNNVKIKEKHTRILFIKTSLHYQKYFLKLLMKSVFLPIV